MKVLWLTDFLMPDLAIALGHQPSPRGGWMPALAEALVDSGEIKLAVATAVNIPNRYHEVLKNVSYFALPKGKKTISGANLPESLIGQFNQVVNEFQPDVIHIHGTEYFQGLLTGRGYLKTPRVISIQGILDVYQRHYFGEITATELIRTRTLRDWFRLDGLFEKKLKWLRRAKWEREIFSSNPAFIGRTLWDRAHTRRLNPDARYYHCDELIRRPFYNHKWEIDQIERHSIFASGASYPLKGFHILIKAVALLKTEFPDISIRTPLASFYPESNGVHRLWGNLRSSGYARYLTDLIRGESLSSCIIPYQSLSAEEMANELLSAHVFVLPSTIENSPNSLGEATLIGTPAVASFVGGIPTMVQDEKSALLFQSGDEAVLAEQIRRIFRDDKLACKLSQEARTAAAERHSKDKIVSDTLRIYVSEIKEQG